ncbi:MAG: Rid family hydrolase [Actinomycetes bacterium]
MGKIAIESVDAPKPGGAYSQGIVAGPLVFTAGMGPNDAASGSIVGTTIEAQTEKTLQNLEAILGCRGLGRDAVVKVTVHLQNLDRDFAGFDSAYRAFFREPFPVRTTVGSDLDGILIEIDCIAYADV